jgi:hypothetical protein
MTCKTAGNCRWDFETISRTNTNRINSLPFSQSGNQMFLTCLTQRPTIEHFHVHPFAYRYGLLSQAADRLVRLLSAAFNRHLSSFISPSLGIHSLVLFTSSSDFKRAGFSQIASSLILKRRIQAQLLNENISPYICPLLIRLSQQCFDETKTGVLNASRRREFS